LLNEITSHKIIRLKNNVIPRGLIHLDRLFDEDDVAKRPTMTLDDEEVESCNLGTQEDPNMVKLTKTLPMVDKGKYVHILKEVRDVFASRYEYLKKYDTSIIQHIIPIQKGEKPFK